jgi:eukaryotic-like serine/threonine-protein kinase
MSHSPTASEAARPAEGLDLTGRLLGDYQVLRRLGRGGMAEVYLAEQISLRRKVALKVLFPSLAGDATYLRRFHHEAQSAAGLVHANIVQIHEVGCIESIHFIAQEYVAGQNLKQLLMRRGPIDTVAAVSIIRQVSAALQRAGQRGVVHRDIKPENILIAPGGEVKVADFGLARATNQSLELTQVGITMGTPLYMSPEQVEGGEIDPRTDIYSFGVTCYQMLAGRPPFDGDSPLAVAVQHLRKAPERLENLRPDIPQGLCRIVHKMLAKAPGDRYQSAGDILRDLRELRVEGSDAEWAALLEENSPDWNTRSDARMEATQQLDALMKTSARALQSPFRLRRAMLGAAAAFLAGGAAAWMLRPQSLLHYDPSKLPPVVKLNSAQAQFLYAEELQTETAYRSVELYFPEDARYVNLARRRLSKIYFRDGNLDAALATFTQLADLPETEAQYRAIGLAGQLAVFLRRNELPRAAAKYRELAPLLRELNDDELKAIVDRFARTQEASAARSSSGPAGAE